MCVALSILPRNYKNNETFINFIMSINFYYSNYWYIYIVSKCNLINISEISKTYKNLYIVFKNIDFMNIKRKIFINRLLLQMEVISYKSSCPFIEFIFF